MRDRHLAAEHAVDAVRPESHDADRPVAVTARLVGVEPCGDGNGERVSHLVDGRQPDREEDALGVELEILAAVVGHEAAESIVAFETLAEVTTGELAGQKLVHRAAPNWDSALTIGISLPNRRGPVNIAEFPLLA